MASAAWRLAPRRLLGRATMYAYKHWWRRFRQWQTGVAVGIPDHAPAPADEDSVPEPAEV